MSAASALLFVALSGCTLAARDHACWPFVDRQYQGHVPGDLKRTLAREHGTRKEVGRQRAPIGYYWRKRQTPTLDVMEIRTLKKNYELAACPRTNVTPTNAQLLAPH